MNVPAIHVSMALAPTSTTATHVSDFEHFWCEHILTVALNDLKAPVRPTSPVSTATAACQAPLEPTVRMPSTIVCQIFAKTAASATSTARPSTAHARLATLAIIVNSQ